MPCDEECKDFPCPVETRSGVRVSQSCTRRGADRIRDRSEPSAAPDKAFRRIVRTSIAGAVAPGARQIRGHFRGACFSREVLDQLILFVPNETIPIVCATLRVHLCGSTGEAGATHGSFLIRRQRGDPGVVLPLVISNSANH